MKIIILLIFIFQNLSQFKAKEEKDIFEEYKNLRFCGADLMKNKIEQYKSRVNELKNNNINTPNRNLETVTYRPIRIFLESKYFETQGNSNTNIRGKLPLLTNALNIAIKGLSGLIEVKDIGYTNLFANIDIPQLLKANYIYDWNNIFNNGNNIQSDFLLVVKFDNMNELPAGVLASAVPIWPEEGTYRPIIGLLTVSIDTSFYNMARVSEYFSEVFLHELTHALGFLYTMFEYFPNGLSYTVNSFWVRGKIRNLIVTPTVKEVAKKYYNCSNIMGVELEDQGGTGSASSHWEQRVLLGDYMGAVIYQEEMTISEITLALLEDSGWYKVNYYTGGLMRFGKNKGCAFLENNCLDTDTYKTEFVNEFFDYENKDTPSCSAGRLSRTYGITYKYSIIYDNDYASNFIKNQNIYESGAIYTADYCLTHGQIAYESNAAYFTGSCKFGTGKYGSNIYYYNYNTKSYENNHPNSELPNELGEVYSNTSFCIMSSLVPKGKYQLYGSILHPMCYQTHCSSSFLTIQINDDYIVCPRQGGNVQVNGYDGKIHCPDYNLICTGTVVCNDMFDCIEKKSLVKEESYYYNYTSLTTQQYSEISKVETLIAYEFSNDGVCPIFCSQCSKNSKCKNCLEGYNLVGLKENDTNPVICDNSINIEKGYYKAKDNTYYLCSDECETCKEKNNNCLTCKENYYFLENTNNCYNKNNYPKGYYFNKEKNVFSPCHKNCRTCSAGPTSGRMNCDSCMENWNYDRKKKSCKKKSNVLLWIFIPLSIIIIMLIIGIIIYIFYKKKYSQSIGTPQIEMTSKN